MRDTILVGVIAGLIGGTAMLAAETAFLILEHMQITSVHLAGQAFLPEGIRLTLPALILGAAIFFTVASALGIVAVYVMAATGRDYLILKGLVYGAVIYVASHSLVTPAALTAEALSASPVAGALFMLSHMVYGVVTLLVAARLRNATREVR